ncbi:CsxC family protein [Desulforamulus ferrireducens]|uniref:DUF7852 domain-containing protein n=1 Tax=Desulforamulus ferrireducens TaxID=1833852 RepID=A0A1S6IVL9_9FIRM|nr:hypothetical protein [Desulforamulus ferrireducens]AQS58825.1 hypothetical protein B0537_06855 [Desulforamulus ferrireducens]
MERCCPPFKQNNVVKGGTLCECPSSTVAIVGLTTGPTVKVPVVLAQLQIQVNLDSVITLPEPALEIKDIKKRVKVTQCLLLQDPFEPVGSPTMLSIKGYIRKNIDYATRSCSNSEGVCGDIRHCTVDVPFNCMTQVVFNGATPASILVNTTDEFTFFRNQPLSGPGFADKDHLLSSDLSEYNQVSQEFFNDLPYCELVSARVVEYDEYLNRQRPCGVNLPFEEKEFRQVEEKAILLLVVKILQNRLVAIPAVGDLTF